MHLAPSLVTLPPSALPHPLNLAVTLLPPYGDDPPPPGHTASFCSGVRALPNGPQSSVDQTQLHVGTVQRLNTQIEQRWAVDTPGSSSCRQAPVSGIKKKILFFFPKQCSWKNLPRLFFQKALRMQSPWA